MSTPRILVVYHTSSGNTRKVAEALADSLCADLEQIQLQVPVAVDIKGKGLRNFLNMGKVVMGSRFGGQAAIEDAVHDPGDYDLVVVGTPVYANTLPAPVRVYLSSYRDRFVALAFFCTGEDPANAHVFDLMTDAAAKAPIAAQPFHAPKIRENRFAPEVEGLAVRLSGGGQG